VIRIFEGRVSDGDASPAVVGGTPSLFASRCFRGIRILQNDKGAGAVNVQSRKTDKQESKQTNNVAESC
jgi:hypothetical protein